MTTPDLNIDDLLPRSVVLQLADRVNYRRPSVLSGSLHLPAGVNMIQCTWKVDASITLFVDVGQGTVVSEWTGFWHSSRSDGQYPVVRVVSDQRIQLGMQAMRISEADLSRHIALSIYPLPS